MHRRRVVIDDSDESSVEEPVIIESDEDISSVVPGTPTKSEKSVISIDDFEDASMNSIVYASDDDGEQGDQSIKEISKNLSIMDIVDDSSDESIVEVEQPAVAAKPASSNGQKSIFYAASDGAFLDQREVLTTKLKRMEEGLKVAQKLPDGGERLKQQIADVQSHLNKLDENVAKNSNDHPIEQNGRAKESPPSTSRAIDNDQAAKPDYGGDKPKIIANPWEARRREDYWKQTYSVDGEQHRLYAGKMTDARHHEARVVTQDAITQLHKAITKCPTPGDETKDSAGLQVPLMEHQRQALTWLLWRENQEPAGGILADDMGLGKTLTMIALILFQKYNKDNSADDSKGENSRKKALEAQKLIPSSSNLVVCPASVLSQWEKEIERRVKPGRLSVLCYHGPKRETKAHRLARFDVVLTTYGTVASELSEKKSGSDHDDFSTSSKSSQGNSPLIQIAWERIILDEAHQIRNHTTSQAQACCKLPANIRWALTGTPLHNHLKDLYSLMKFLRYTPFSELAVWKDWIEVKNQPAAKSRLDTIVKGILLRRTKEQTSLTTGKALVELPPKRYEVEKLEFTPLERRVYETMFASAQLYVKELLQTREEKDEELIKVSTGQATAEELGYRNPFKGRAGRADEAEEGKSSFGVLVMLLRLRQACVHLSLTKDAMDLDSLAHLGAEKEPDVHLAEKLNDMSLLDDEDDDGGDMAAASDGARKDIAALFEKMAMSTKVKAVLDRLDRFRNNASDGPRPKFVLVSQWVQLLYLLGYHLKNRGIPLTMISGDVNPEERGKRIDAFNDLRGGPQVMLLSLTAGGVGVNLVGGNHLFVIDLHWNPAMEKQACDRIYRVGQTRNVFVHKFVVKDTIEERVLALQESKLKLAESVLSGAGEKSMGKLTLHDLKFLFGLS